MEAGGPCGHQSSGHQSSPTGPRSRSPRHLRRWLLRARPRPDARPSSGAARSGPWPGQGASLPAQGTPLPAQGTPLPAEGPAPPAGPAPPLAALPLPAARREGAPRTPCAPRGRRMASYSRAAQVSAAPPGPCTASRTGPRPPGSGRARRVPRGRTRSRCVRHVWGQRHPRAGLKAACGGALPFTGRERRTPWALNILQ